MNVIPIGSYSEILESLAEQYDTGSLELDEVETGSDTLIRDHFKPYASRVYGVYLIRLLDTGEVIYIGKAGTVRRDGQLKGQGLKGRLTNRRGRVSAAEWFGGLIEQYGSLEIEYFILNAKESPGFVESTLLQAFLIEQGSLPSENSVL